MTTQTTRFLFDMKVILDCEPAEMGMALNQLFRVTSQNPTQKSGRASAVREKVGGKTVEVIKNLDSYTVKISK
jgi:hypothetical protein